MNPSPKVSNSSYFDPSTNEWVTTISIRHPAQTVKVSEFKPTSTYTCELPSHYKKVPLFQNITSYIPPQVSGSNPGFSWSDDYLKNHANSINEYWKKFKPSLSTQLLSSLTSSPLPAISVSQLSKLSEEQTNTVYKTPFETKNQVNKKFGL